MLEGRKWEWWWEWADSGAGGGTAGEFERDRWFAFMHPHSRMLVVQEFMLVHRFMILLAFNVLRSSYDSHNQLFTTSLRLLHLRSTSVPCIYPYIASLHSVSAIPSRCSRSPRLCRINPRPPTLPFPNSSIPPHSRTKSSQNLYTEPWPPKLVVTPSGYTP